MNKVKSAFVSIVVRAFSIVSALYYTSAVLDQCDSILLVSVCFNSVFWELIYLFKLIKNESLKILHLIKL